MRGFRQSIRQKVTLGYYAIVVLIVGLSLFTFLELRLIERKIMFGEAISEFFDTTLEVRRFEKNYFLYGQKSDYQENLAYATKARELLDSNLSGYAALASAWQVAILHDRLSSYRTLMDEYAALATQTRRNAPSMRRA